MYKTVNFTDFCNSFVSHDRQNQFSYEAKQMIFDYLEQLEIDTGEGIELDIISICCDFAEATESEIKQSYGYDTSEFEYISDFLDYHTVMLGFFDNEKTKETTYIFYQF